MPCDWGGNRRYGRRHTSHASQTSVVNSPRADDLKKGDDHAYPPHAGVWAGPPQFGENESKPTTVVRYVFGDTLRYDLRRDPTTETETAETSKTTGNVGKEQEQRNPFPLRPLGGQSRVVGTAT